MRISYNKLWKMLIDKEMNRNDLEECCRNQCNFHCQVRQRSKYHN